jgi:YD repeat-containing protein
MRRLVACLVVAGCGGAPPPRAEPTPPPPEPIARIEEPEEEIEEELEGEALLTPDEIFGATPETGCRRIEGDSSSGTVVESVYQLDENGLIASFESSNDAAAFASIERYEHDRRGRMTRLVLEVTEGYEDRGDLVGPQPPVRVTHRQRGRTIEVHAGDDVERWEFDEAGRPIAVELDGGRRVECGYDERGRLVRRGDTRFEYEVDAPLPARAIGAGGTSVVRRRGAWISFESEEEGAYFTYDAWAGACAQLMAGTCSPLRAPPPPGGQRVLLPAEGGQR